MMKKQLLLSDIFSDIISGDWGDECPDGISGTKVLRTTNFTNSGNVNYDDVVERIISQKNIEKKKLKPGDIILEKSGGSDNFPVGRVVYFENRDETYLCNNFTMALRADEKLANSRYIFLNLFYLYGKGITKKYQNKTTGIRNLKTKDYLKTKISIPVLSEQQHIVSVLDTVSSLIDARKKQIALLDEAEKSLFVEMFGDTETNPFDLYVGKIEEVCSSIVRGPFGSSLKKEYFVEPDKTTYKVYEQKHAIQKSAVIGSYYITKEKYAELKRFECLPGDILMSCSGTVGKLYQLPTNSEKGIINQALCKFTLNEKILSVVFLFIMEDMIHHIETKGTGIKNIASVSYIKNSKIIIPPLSLQKEFAARISAIEDRRREMEAGLQQMEEARSALMQEYFG